jgi:microcystin-dependent protein
MEQQRKSQKWLWIAAVLACAGAQGPKGDTGETGLAGQNALVSVAAESPGGNCSGGGISVKSGLDSNGNGSLDASEVTNTSYVCNGALDTPAQVLAKVVQVDGAGSGLDADQLDGIDSATLITPAGTVMAFAGPSGRVPSGWFLCDGRAISRTAFPNLFAAIGVFHGIGDGTTTFNIPDYRGRFLRGVDYTANRDPDKNSRTVVGAGTGVVANEVGSVQGYATARPVNAFGTSDPGNHNHNNGGFDRLMAISGGGNNTPTGFDTSPGEVNILNSGTITAAGAHTHSITGGDNESRPVNGYVNYIIKI